ncbi:MAG: DUF4258 domain-containing protein [Nitrospinota bacterium]
MKKGNSRIEHEFSQHARDMLKERNIREAWVRLAVENPEKREPKEDGTVHYIRSIGEHGGRCLRVVVNPAVQPPRILTLFFDRRLGKLP